MLTFETQNQLMKAMILAAGLGTRLRPLTNDRPKAMVLLNGKPLLEHAINYLKRHGIDEIIVNVHHFSEQIIGFLKEKDFGIRICISDETAQLLETGGGLLKSSWFLKRSVPFVLYNVDIFTTLNLSKMINEHVSKQAMVTLATRMRYSSRNLLFDSDNQLVGWRNNKTGEYRPDKHIGPYSLPLAFSGVSVMSPQIFDYINRPVSPFSIVDVWLELCHEFPMQAHRHDDTLWMDLGKPANLREAETLLLR